MRSTCPALDGVMEISSAILIKLKLLNFVEKYQVAVVLYKNKTRGHPWIARHLNFALVVAI